MQPLAEGFQFQGRCKIGKENNGEKEKTNKKKERKED
jgi:hypothetical protein